ncbi:stAR-related lipid transfer protein 3-like isoform X3 [Halichondria panicea]|uniref:stAR-related lipid transfer protein 3-like isoform X3 n=1 Tax=Halichondria panicea TaxID=6063 RepID=UPI00312B3511
MQQQLYMMNESLKDFMISEEEVALSDENSSDCNIDDCSTNLDQVVRRIALSALKGLIELTKNNDRWSVKKVNEITCYSKHIGGRKVLKLESFIETSAQHLWSILYPGDNTTEWNTQCGGNEIVYRVDNATDIICTISNALGPIAARDFVSARKAAFTKGAYYLASQSIVTDLKPEEKGKVRGENGPCGFVVTPISEDSCHFVWVYNSSMKGWLPQVMVDQAASAALIGAHQRLLTYAKER